MQAPEHEPQGTHVHRRVDAAADPADHRRPLAEQLGNAATGRVVNAPGVQRAGATGAQQLDESVARAIEERRGRGSPLSEPVRRDMETALGHDLSEVRIHTDATAHQLNEAVSARAFTAGTDVFFKQGTYDPASASGRQLLGHELTHVVQQSTGTSGLRPGEVSHPSDAAEQHAEAVGRDLSSPAAGPEASAPAVARQEEPEEEEMVQQAPDVAVARQEEEEELFD
jgi:hypothetical protein